MTADERILILEVLIVELLNDFFQRRYLSPVDLQARTDHLKMLLEKEVTAFAQAADGSGAREAVEYFGSLIDRAQPK